MTQQGRSFNFTGPDLQMLWQRNPMALEMLKVICLERELAEREAEIATLLPKSPNGIAQEVASAT